MSRFAPSISAVFLAAFLAIASLATPLRATTISVGNLTGSPVALLPNTPNQWVPVYVSGNDTNLHGTDLFVLVGDGGPELTQYSLPAGHDAPGMDDPSTDVDITGIDLSNNPILGAPTPAPLFAGGSSITSDQFGGSGGSIPQLIGFSGELAGTGSVSDSPTGSILAWLRFNTTGFTSGSWPVKLDDSSIDGLSDFTDLFSPGGSTLPNVVLQSGSITIAVPEPDGFLLAAMALMGLAGVVRFRGMRQRRTA